MADYGVTAEGYVAPRTADFLTLIRAEYEELTGLVVDWERDTFLGNATAIMASRLGELGEMSQAIYDSWDVNNATGLQLANLALIVGVTKNPATRSTATLTATGTTGTIILQGKRFEGGGPGGKARWTTTTDVTLVAGTGQLLVEAEDLGAIAAQATEISKIVTPVSGLTSVTNAAAASTGEAEETDDELRIRRQQSLQISGGGSTNAIRANLLEIDGIIAAAVIANPDFEENVVQGLTMDPSSVMVIIWPNGLTAAKREEVAYTIYRQVSAGIKTMGTDVVVEVTKGDGFTETIRFDYADILEVVILVTVVLASGFELDDVETEIRGHIDDYFLTLTVGSAVRQLPLYGLIGQVEGVEEAEILINGLDADLEPLVTQIPVQTDTTVTE